MKSLESIDNPGDEEQCTSANRKGDSPIPSNIACKRSNLQASVSKEGSPSQDELEWLSPRLGQSWEKLARRLGFHDGDITGFDKDNEEYAKKALSMLFKWKEREGSDATYKLLRQALCHEFVKRKDLAEGLDLLQLQL